jgi:hypothetical protein
MLRHKTGGVSKLLKHLWANEIATYLSSKGVRLIASGKEVLDNKATPAEKREFLQQQDVACGIIQTTLGPSALSIGSHITVHLLGKLQMEYAPSTSAYLMEVGMKLLNVELKPSQGLTGYFREIDQLHGELAQDKDRKLSEKWCKLITYKGLPHDYDTVHTLCVQGNINLSLLWLLSSCGPL